MLIARESADVRVDDRKQVEDVRQDQVCLECGRPLCHIRLHLVCKSGIERQILNKRAERSPREGAPDILQIMTRTGQQVVFNCLSVTAYQL